jgi:hypothetical protein
MDQDKREDELAHGGHRISLTFRHIATFRRRSDSRLFGLGARHKSEEALLASNDEPIDDAEEMLKAFSAENRQEEFDWDAHYGRGFDALNFKIFNSDEQRAARAEARQTIVSENNDNDDDDNK